MELGRTVSESSGPPAGPPPDPITVKLALELTGPLYAIAFAVTVVVPAPTAVTNPEALTVATAGTVEDQVTPVAMFCVVEWLALP
jgi:hypothetical protein